MHHFQAYSSAKKQPDFIGRNRRAAHEAGKEKEKRGKEKLNGKQGKTGEQSRGRGVSPRETVVVSKSYLEQLLRMSVAGPPLAASSVAPAQQGPAHRVPAYAAGPALSAGITSAPHIQPDPTLVPGLLPPWAAREQGPTIHAPADRQADRAQQQAAALSPQEQWAADLAQQRREQAARREEEKRQRRGDRECAPQEEYCPWGRPGGGAPIRTTSGTLLTDYSTRSRAVEEMRRSKQWQPSNQQQQTYPLVQQATYTPKEDLQTLHQPQRAPLSDRSPHKTSPQKPQFARGMGPHVDSFILSQRDEQRRKDLSHKEQLAAQIAERERQRQAERRQREAEEREAEERVRMDLEAMNRRKERERERRQQKEEEQRSSQAVLQARIEAAEEAACRERQLAKRGQRENETLPPKRAAQPSRIPLPRASRPPAPSHSRPDSRPDRRPDRAREVSHRYQEARHDRTTPRTHRPRPPSSGQHRYYRHADHTQPVAQWEPAALAPSPPLPAVARARVGRLPPYSSAPSHTPPPTHTPPPPHRPPLSPIVPALAKKLGMQAAARPNGSPDRLPNHTSNASAAQPPPPPTSPPIPAVARRQQQQQQLVQPTYMYHSTAQPPPPPTSPPIPAVARRQQQQQLVQPTYHSTAQPHSHLSPSLSIHRPPSCRPCAHSTPPNHTLPPLTQSQEHSGTKFPNEPPHMVARQQTILHQLAILREGILSQKSSVDTRLQHLP